MKILPKSPFHRINYLNLQSLSAKKQLPQPQNSQFNEQNSTLTQKIIKLQSPSRRTFFFASPSFEKQFSIEKHTQQQQQTKESSNSPTKTGEQTPCFNTVTEKKSQKFQDCVAMIEKKQREPSAEYINENMKLQKEIQRSNQTIKSLIRKAKTPEIYSAGLSHFNLNNHNFNNEDTDRSNQTIDHQPLQLSKKTVSEILKKHAAGKQSFNLNNYSRVNTSGQIERPNNFTKKSLKINFQLPPIAIKISQTPQPQIKRHAYFPKNDFNSDNNLPNSNEIDYLSNKCLPSEENYQLIPRQKESKSALIRQVFATKPLKKFF